jgi:hypothetical protein
MKQYLNSLSRGAARQSVPAAKAGGAAAITQQEVESALKQRVAAWEADKAGGCNWRGSAGELTIQVFDPGRAGFEAAKSHSPGTTPFSNIGDEAFGSVSLAGFVQIQLIKNGHFVALTLDSPRDPSKLETAKGLARKISGRL